MRWRSRRRHSVGLLGGSFNPAHEGHLSLSLMALKRLRLDEVWWLVSPQNPLKRRSEMAPLDYRIESAKEFCRHPRIRVSDIEARLETRYTVDTLVGLKQRFPSMAFVWLMGADNLIQLPQWRDWSRIFHTVPIAIFNRPSYALRALAGEAAQRFRGYRIPEQRAEMLSAQRPPAWVFIRAAYNPTSATAIRRRGAVEQAPGSEGETRRRKP